MKENKNCILSIFKNAFDLQLTLRLFTADERVPGVGGQPQGSPDRPVYVRTTREHHTEYPRQQHGVHC